MDKKLIDKLIELKDSLDLTVLYVEDNEDIKQETLEILKQFFNSLETASDGEEGLEKFKKTKFDIVITDVSMPKMNGVKMVKQIKNIDKKIPVIVITAFNDFEYLSEFIKIGAYGYILKPIDMNQLLEAIYRVSEKVRLRRERDDALALLEQYKHIIDKSSTVTKTDLDGIITYANDKFCQTTGYTKKELIGKPHNIIRHPDMPESIFKELWDTIQNKNIWQNILKNRTKDGKTVYMKVTIAPILNQKKEIIEYIAVRQDITELMNPKKLLHDKVAELEKPVLLLCRIEDYEDLENFYDSNTLNMIEDNFFEESKKFFPDGCSFEYSYNLGGGEFAFLREYDSQKSLNEFLSDIKQFQDNVANSVIDVEGYEYDMDVILSFAFEKQNILENVRLGIKKAEQEKINIVFADKLVAEMHEKSKKNIETLKMIKNAINDNRIVSYYQPIYNNFTKEIEKYESLVRLIREDGEVLSPFFFLDVAKIGKYYKQITLIVFDNVINAIKKTKKEISINLSSIDIEDKTIRNSILNRLNDDRELSSHLVVELLEDEGINQFDVMKNFIKDMKQLGAKIAIDDFGSGYSNFSRLLEYEPDYLKIDASLMKNIANDEFSLNIVETIKSFADKQGYQVVAEYVADKAIFDIINKLGIEYSQGYYIGKPEPLNF